MIDAETVRNDVVILKSGEFAQKPDEMLSKMQYITKIQKIMQIFLDRVAEVSPGNQQ